MKDIIGQLRERAKKEPRKIIFSDREDERVRKAIKYIEREGIAYPCLLTSERMEAKKIEEFAARYYERKKHKGLTFQDASDLMKNPLYYGAMMTALGDVDGFIAGATFKTSSVIRTAINCLEIDSSGGIVSSCFIIAVPDCPYGEEGVFVYADCAVIPYPSSLQIAQIAISSAQFAKDILKFTPRVALLSFSTKKSAGGEGVAKIKKALEIVKEKDKQLLVDGELQADAALLPEVARRKLDKSDVAGKANVLIFPNLDAGNICYKLTQRLAKARAVGPIILGTGQPCSDLSRGCEVDDIIDCAAVTVIRSQLKRKVKNSTG